MKLKINGVSISKCRNVINGIQCNTIINYRRGYPICINCLKYLKKKRKPLRM